MNADGSIIAVADARDGAVTLVSTSDGRMRGIAGETPVALDRRLRMPPRSRSTTGAGCWSGASTTAWM